MTGPDKRVKLILACPMTTGCSDPFRRTAVSAAHLGRHLFQMQMTSRLLAALALTAALTLSIRAALASGAIVGLAPSGTEVTVSVEYDADGDQGDVTRVTALTDDSGQFRADFAGQRALARGMGGQLVAVIRGVRFVAGWSAPRLAVDLGVTFPETYSVQANVPADQTARLRMTDAAGRLVLEAAQTVGFAPFPGFPGESCCMYMVNLRLRGPDGATVLPLAGDRMELAVGDERVAMTVDPLAATVFAAEDRIVGRTRPDVAVTVDVRRTPRWCPG